MAPRYELEEKIAIATKLQERFGITVTRKEIMQFTRDEKLLRRPHWILNDKSIRAARSVYNMVDVITNLTGKKDGGETTTDTGEAAGEVTETNVSE